MPQLYKFQQKSSIDFKVAVPQWSQQGQWLDGVVWLIGYVISRLTWHGILSSERDNTLFSILMHLQQSGYKKITFLYFTLTPIMLNVEKRVKELAPRMDQFYVSYPGESRF